VPVKPKDKKPTRKEIMRKALKIEENAKRKGQKRKAVDQAPEKTAEAPAAEPSKKQRKPRKKKDNNELEERIQQAYRERDELKKQLEEREKKMAAAPKPSEGTS
jgi:hypothetical protein